MAESSGGNWYKSRFAYRSVAFRTWDVGGAARLRAAKKELESNKQKIENERETGTSQRKEGSRLVTRLIVYFYFKVRQIRIYVNHIKSKLGKSATLTNAFYSLLLWDSLLFLD